MFRTVIVFDVSMLWFGLPVVRIPTPAESRPSRVLGTHRDLDIEIPNKIRWAYGKGAGAATADRAGSGTWNGSCRR